MFPHKRTTWLFFGTNNFQYDLHLSSFSVHITSKWLIHWGFQKFASVSCLFPHLSSFVGSLFLVIPLPPYTSLCAEALFEVSVSKGPMSICLLPSYLWSQSSDLVLLTLSAHPRRVGCFIWNLSSKSTGWNWIGIESCAHVPAHTCMSRAAAAQSSASHWQYGQGIIDFNSPHTVIPVWCLCQVARAYALRYEACNVSTYRAKLCRDLSVESETAVGPTASKQVHSQQRSHCHFHGLIPQTVPSKVGKSYSLF